jgi:hypothetical protein
VMGTRLELHAVLLDIMPENQKNVYFQPPNGLVMKYPCITYERSTIQSEYADNSAYNLYKRYEATVIDKSPDSELPDKVAMLPLCSHDRFFAVDNLNHDVFTLFF